MRQAARENAFARKFFEIVLWIGYLLASRERDERRNSKVDANGVRGSRKLSNALILAEQRDVPAASSIETHSYTRRFGSIGKRAAPADIQRRIHLGQRQLPIDVPEAAPRELGGTSRMLSFENGVLRSLSEEVAVRGLQIPQCLLKRHARYFVQKRQIVSLLPCRQVPALRCIPDRLLASRPGFGALMQSSIVNEPSAPKRSAKQAIPAQRSGRSEIGKPSKHRLQE